MIPYKLKILDIIDEAKGTKTYYLEKPDGFTWEEGSNVHIGLPGFDEGEQPNKNLVRHMSIITIPDESKIAFTTRVPGSSSEFKNKLSNLNIGDEVTLYKVGSRMPLRRCNRPIILLSMGVGISSMRSIILAFFKDKSDIPELINVNVDSDNEFIYRNELDKLQNDNCRNYWLGSRVAFYNTLQELLETEDAIYYIVGSDAFIKDIIQRLKGKNVKDADIIIDKKVEHFPEYFR